MTPETTLGGPVIAEVYPGTEHVEIQLSSGKSFPDDSMPQGPAFDLRGCFSVAEAKDGSSTAAKVCVRKGIPAWMQASFTLRKAAMRPGTI